MKRLMLCGVLMCALPLLGTTYQYGKCEIEMTGSGTFWQKLKAQWTVTFGNC